MAVRFVSHDELAKINNEERLRSKTSKNRRRGGTGRGGRHGRGAQRRLSTEINFRHDTQTENFPADLINTRTALFFDAKDLITFLRRLVNHPVEATAATASFLPSHKIKSSKPVCEERAKHVLRRERRRHKSRS